MIALASPRAAASRLLRAIEPWYDWGTTTIFRLDAHCPNFSDESAGDRWLFEIQWFGAHLGITIGRAPPSVVERA